MCDWPWVAADSGWLAHCAAPTSIDLVCSLAVLVSSSSLWWSQEGEEQGEEERRTVAASEAAMGHTWSSTIAHDIAHDPVGGGERKNGKPIDEFQ